MNTQYLEYVRQQLIVATADLSGATKGQLVAFAENAQFTATARSRGRKKVYSEVKQKMVNPDGPPMSGSQSRAKGSSIALVLPVEYSTASWRRALLSLEEHQKSVAAVELQRQYPLGAPGDDHPVGMGAFQRQAGRRAHCKENSRSPPSTYLAGRAGCQSRAGRAGDL
ncbi:phage antitermination protein Q [Klebsiella pneumoniae subsp. ozaenae]|uniref:Phage antitermination protein Q n=1 Tax=Klebsiella pneumoniae subsp. ozaenae TaxID=574 RepID=A0A378ABQ2_KLEPO|nr:phage antitermination protein Q [Klebsiella pneumoniae subsp. ozaenae]